MSKKPIQENKSQIAYRRDLLSKNIEVIFDCGCFKSVIPESFVKSSGLDCISYRNCGFVANDVKIEIFGATVNTLFKYKNTVTNMSFIILPRHNILLGMDWLSLNNATINFGTRTICFKEEPFTFHNIINDSLKNYSNQLCLSTLDQTNDKIDKPMEEPPDKVDNELTDPNEIKRFKEFFSIVTKDLEKSNCILEYYIETTDQKPVSFEPYGRSIFEKELLNKDVDKMIRANIIEPDDSIEGFWSEYSNFLKLKTSFEEVEIDLTNPNDIRMVKEFLTQNSDLFAESTDDLEENFSILEYHIVTTDEKTTSFKPYRLLTTIYWIRILLKC
jgi:hypothetical protein